MKISVIFVGALHDNGFNQCAFKGVEQARRTAPERDIDVVSGIPYDPSAMSQQLLRAATHSDGVVFVGGQGNRVTPDAAARFPDRAFAVVQGNATGPNLASYDVLQEQSAFLAGVLAARMSKTGKVGHLSGHRVVPGLKGRAAFAEGVRYADEGVRLVTGFCGTQDDSTTTEAWARAFIAEGADYLFTMLNAAREGATQACRETGARQIGNAADWCAIDPDVFVASAVARIDLGVLRAISDMLSEYLPEKIVHLGIREEAAALSMGGDIPEEFKEEIAGLAQRIAQGDLAVRTTYDGPEFEAVA